MLGKVNSSLLLLCISSRDETLCVLDSHSCLTLSNIELSLESNPWANDSTYRYYCINNIKSLKFLDGKRISDQERRNASKSARREAEKLREVERVTQKQEQK
jgi:hypothetical protein